MKALQYHFTGEVNMMSNMGWAKHLYNNKHYKNESAVSFEICIIHYHNMYNLYGR